MIDLDRCIAEGLLRRIPPSARQAEEQMKKSHVLLEEAKKSLRAGAPNSAFISAYASALDAARAVLFNDGYREKSHACVARYLEAKYSKALGASLIDLFDQYRDKRHKTMYSGVYYPTVEEAKRVILFAEEFTSRIRDLLKRRV